MKFAPPKTRYGRADRSELGRWFWEVDKVLLLMLAALIGIGLIAVAAASPAAAERYSGGDVRIPELYFFTRQLMWLAVSIPIMLIVSMMSREKAKRWSLIGAGILFVALALVPFIGSETNGAQRWLDLGISRFQPSEFLKAFYIVAIAWIFSLKKVPGALITGAWLLMICVLLMMQPDFGTTVLFAAVWVALFALSGANVRVLGGLAVLGVVGIIAAYFFYDVATARIDAFLFGEGDDFQTRNAMATLTAGGLFGLGPGAGTRKFTLPEPQTDYIFSVIGEEFGLIACLIIAVLYLAIVARVLIKLLDEDDRFTILAASGLVIMFGLQAFINMAVNVQIAPSKGMTLPFISYGGSSMIALSIMMGLLLAFTRANPYLNRSPYVVKWSAT
ncbi:MAG: cell division protein FtsW [Sphingomonas sp.]|nr:cell division protein FtsW [Sphingomonas sp.]RZV53462.1 MAG: cell division protein FtsW [Sphingomonadaceae bacterium]